MAGSQIGQSVDTQADGGLFSVILAFEKKLATQAPMAGSQSSQSVATQMDTQARFGYFHTYISFQYIYMHACIHLYTQYQIYVQL